MRRSLVHRSVVVLFLIVSVLPATAAPRRDDASPSLLKRIVKIVKQLLPLDTIEVNVPKP
jgi:hypothetical protein